jgi:hypothetical protein
LLLGVIPVPINAIDFGAMGDNSGERCGSVADVPDVQALVMGTCNDLLILSVPLDLSRTCHKVSKFDDWAFVSQVMHKHEAVHTTSS